MFLKLLKLDQKIVTSVVCTMLNPLPLLFKAVLHGQKDCVFFSWHLIYIPQQERFRVLAGTGHLNPECFGTLGMANG
jgi:hypothetical protein